MLGFFVGGFIKKIKIKVSLRRGSEGYVVLFSVDLAKVTKLILL